MLQLLSSISSTRLLLLSESAILTCWQRARGDTLHTLLVAAFSLANVWDEHRCQRLL